MVAVVFSSGGVDGGEEAADSNSEAARARHGTSTEVYKDRLGFESLPVQ
jgi:hypothetical protein